MRAVITRVNEASVTVDDEVVAHINPGESCGLLALIGIGHDETDESIELMARKLAELRILPGEVSAESQQAPILLVSQFTLLGDARKGRRPSWSAAASGEVAEPIFNRLVELLRERGLPVQTGVFGAMMNVASTNSGPFTIWYET